MGLLWASLPCESGADPDPDSGYETVVHADAVEQQRPADDPANFSTVLRIKAAPAGAQLADVVRRVPGLRVKDSGPGGGQTLSLRGTDSQQAVVFLDGVRLTTPAGGGVDLSLLDPGQLERVEVRRGGGSARFGSDALGGVLLLSTPRLRTVARTRASVGYGSWNSISALASRSDSVKRKFRYLVSGSYRQSDGDFSYVHHLNGTPAVRENNDSRQGGLLLKGDYLVNDDWQVGLLDQLSMGWRGAPGILDYACSTARQQDLRNLAALRATRRDAILPRGQLDLALHYRFGNFRFSQPCEFNQPSDNNNHGIGATATLALPLPGAGRVDGGLELRQNLLQDLQGTLADELIARTDVDLWVSSTFTGLTPDLTLVPAVRLAVTSDQGATVVPKLGLVLRPLRWTGFWWLAPLELVANVGRSFRHPSFQELYVNLDTVQGNPDLQPEDAFEVDVGLRWEHPLLALEAAFYRRRVKNLILYAPVSPYVSKAENYSGVDADGAEVALGLNPGWGLRLRGAYTYTNTSWSDPSLQLPGHPKHRFVGRLAWRWPWDRRRVAGWSLGLWTGVTVESAMVLDLHNNIEVDGRVLLSAGGSASWRWLTLTAEGRNLLDRRDLLDTLGFPLPPARFLVTLAAAL